MPIALPPDIPVKQAVTSTSIRHEIDRFLLSKTWHEPPSRFWNMWLGGALLFAATGMMQLWVATHPQCALFLGAAVVLVFTAPYGPKLLAILTRTGWWEKPLPHVMVMLVSDTYGDNSGVTRAYLGKVAAFLTHLATAPRYLSEVERLAYWRATLTELAYHATTTRALLAVRQQRKVAQHHFVVLRGEVPPPSGGILPPSLYVETPLVRTARTRLAALETKERALTTYLAAITATLETRQQELHRAMTTTDLVLPLLPPVALLPYSEVTQLRME